MAHVDVLVEQGTLEIGTQEIHSLHANSCVGMSLHHVPKEFKVECFHTWMRVMMVLIIFGFPV